VVEPVNVEDAEEAAVRWRKDSGVSHWQTGFAWPLVTDWRPSCGRQTRWGSDGLVRQVR
jgi:hypothetical protein